MYYTANPCADAERWNDDQEALSDAADAMLERKTEELRDEFLHHALRDVSKPAKFSPHFRTYKETVADVMSESLDYEGGPQFADLMQILADSARGEDVSPRAFALVKRMADKYAEFNAEESL